MPAVKIGTHDGGFHCDEILAIVLLKKLPAYEQAEIVRTRDPDKLKNCDVLVDVGYVYDHANKLYDHHQNGFKESMSTLSLQFNHLKDLSSRTTKLSSAGLVYAHYGWAVIEQMCPDLNRELTERNVLNVNGVQRIFKRVYLDFVEAIDASDNGQPTFTGRPLVKTATTLTHRVKNMRMRWNEDGEQTDERWMALFNKAHDVVAAEFDDLVEYLRDSWLPAVPEVKEALERCVREHSPLLLLPAGLPWKDHLRELQSRYNDTDRPKFVIYPYGTMWHAQAIQRAKSKTKKQRSCKNKTTLEERSTSERQAPAFCETNSWTTSYWKLFPVEWRGRDVGELVNIFKLDGAMFCHQEGHVCGNRTKEGAEAMAMKALDWAEATVAAAARQ